MILKRNTKLKLYFQGNYFSGKVKSALNVVASIALGPRQRAENIPNGMATYGHLLGLLHPGCEVRRGQRLANSKSGISDEFYYFPPF